jgi:hypothetical protein
MSCGYFFNASEGLIGTGNYLGGSIASIYYTTNGGARWIRAELPSTSIVGEVTDIFFRDSASGWATLTEATPTGWSGIYHTTDRGRTWKLIHQAGFPVGIRETSRGIFYTDRDISSGVNLSTDGGRSWRNVFDLSSCLGIDFYDDDNGFATSQAYSSPPAHIATTDGGMTWHYVPTNAEAWTVLADPERKMFLLSSEQNNGGTGSMSGLIAATSTGTTEAYVHFDPPFGLTGGIAANRTRSGSGCARYTYAQVRHIAGSLQPGFLRTTDGGSSWTQVTGPCNRADTRFVVTGGGAVLFAGDSVGGVWRTTNGGGKGLTPSALPELRLLATTASTRASVCDSATGVVLVTYDGCDSIAVSNISFAGDALGELTLVRTARDKSFSGYRDSIVFQYRPRAVRVLQAQIRITVRGWDGYAEDTALAITLIGSPTAGGSVAFANAGSPATLDFDSVSLCSTESRTLTGRNASCYDLTLFGVSVGAPFRLRSQFSPFQLAPNEERSFIVEYSPTGAGLQTGYFVFTHEQGTDTLRLRGTGYSATSTFSVGTGTIEASECDSATSEVLLKNLTCGTLRFVTIRNAAHVRAAFTSDSVAAGSNAAIALALGPGTTGSGRDTIRIEYQDGSALHDTTIVVSWRLKPGTPSITVANALDFGTLSACSPGVLDTIAISNDGCGVLTVSAAIDDGTQGFVLVSSPSSVAAGSRGEIVIRYVPATSGGAAVAHLILHTNAGDSSVTLRANASSSAGALTLSQTAAPATLPCETSSFSVSIRNSGCDSVYLVSEDFVQGTDFGVAAEKSGPMPRDASATIALLFSPHDSLTRSDVLVLHFRRSDGSAFDTSIAVSGVGRSVAPIVFAVPRLLISAQAGQGVAIPVYALTSSAVAVQRADIWLKMNTDLLTALRLVAGRGAWSGANMTLSVVDRQTLKLSIVLPGAQMVVPGELFALECRAQVTAELATDVRLLRVVLDDGGATSACLPTALALDSAAQFALDALCGDQTIADLIAGRDLSLDDISPSPTRGSVSVRLSNRADQAVDVMLEIYDVTGERQLALPVTIAAHAHSQSIAVALIGSEGIRYITVRMPSGRVVGTRSVVLQK